MKKIIFSLLVVGQIFAFTSINATKENILQLKQQHIPIIDIRLSSEWKATGTIPSALKITFFTNNGSINPDFEHELLKHLITKNAKFAIICRTGHRTKIAAQILERNGYKNFINLKNGMFGLFKSLLKEIKNGK